MAKFVFELDGEYGETSLFLPIAGNLVFLFSPAISGYVSFCNRAYEVVEGRVEIPVGELPVGEFSPELVVKGRIWKLPRLIFDGESVYPKPFDDEDVRELSRKLRELKDEIAALLIDAKKLKEKVYGKLELL